MSKKPLLLSISLLLALSALSALWFYVSVQLKARVDHMLQEVTSELRKEGVVFIHYGDLSIKGLPLWEIHLGQAKLLLDAAKILKEGNGEIVSPWTLSCRNTTPLVIKPNLLFSEYTLEISDPITCYSETNETETFSLEVLRHTITFSLNDSPVTKNNTYLSLISYKGELAKLIHQAAAKERLMQVAESHIVWRNNREKFSLSIKNDGLEFTSALDELIAQNHYVSSIVNQTFFSQYGKIAEDIAVEYMGPNSFALMREEPVYVNIKKLYHSDDTGVSDYSVTIHLQPSSYPWPNITMKLKGSAKAEAKQYQLYRSQITALRKKIHPLLWKGLDAGLASYIAPEQLFNFLDHESFLSLTPKVYAFGKVDTELEFELGAKNHKKYGMVPMLTVKDLSLETEVFDIKTKGALLHNGDQFIGKLIMVLEDYPVLTNSFVNYLQRGLAAFNSVGKEEDKQTLPRHFARNINRFLNQVAFKRDNDPARLYIGMSFSERSPVPSFSKVKRSQVQLAYAMYIEPYIEMFKRTPIEEEIVLPPLKKAYTGKYAKSLKSIHQKALSGDTSSQYKMGIIYVKGLMGVKKDVSIAAKFLQAAAKAGHEKASKITESLGL